MKIALLFGIFPEENYSEIISNSKGVVQYAADALQKSLIEGLGSFFSDLEVINLPYIGSYPKRYARLYSPVGEFKYKTANGNVINGKNVRFCNLAGYKLYSRYVSASRELKNWYVRNAGEEKILIIYAIHTPFIKACVELKNKCTSDKLRIILVVPDLPEYMDSDDQSYVLRKLKAYNKGILNGLYCDIDAFVLLSKYMVDMLPVGNKYWTVVEGIFNKEKDAVAVTEKENNGLKVIFYSGTLAKRYGILNLVRAFSLLPHGNLRLEICGDGDALDEIKEFSSKDNRIIYLGQRKREEVLMLQKKATLLVNPRTPEGEFTKYSFPSKTMEYLASGTPTLLYRLPGIPNEYYKYCFSIEKSGINELSRRIDEILNMDECELKRIGKEAQKFIYEEKNPYSQARKIIELIELIK